MQPETETSHLRTEIKYLMVDLGMAHGAKTKLAKALGVTKQELSSATTGYVQTPAAQRLLVRLRDHLIYIKEQLTCK